MSSMLLLCTVLVLCEHLVSALPYVSQMPICENTDYGTIVVTVSFGKDNTILGSGTPEFYILQYRKEEEPWQNFVTVKMPSVENMPTGYEKNFTITGLESGEVYNVRVLLADSKMNKYDGELVPFYIIPIMCYLPEEYDYQIIASDTNGTPTFSWKYKNANERWCPILTYQVSWTAIVGNDDNGNWQKQETPRLSFKIPHFSPNQKIQFRVRAVTTGGYAPFSKSLKFPSEPEVLPYVSQMPNVENTDYGTIVVTVSFGKNNTILGTGTPKYYILQCRKEGESWQNFAAQNMPSAEDMATYEKKFTIFDLESGEIYNVRVLLADREMNIYDGELVPFYIIPIMCYLPEEYDYQIAALDTNDSLTFSWKYKNANERWCPILTYQVSWMAVGNDDNGHWQKQETPRLSFTIPHFHPNQKIQFRVRAVTTGGYAPFSKSLTFPSETQAASIESLEVVKTSAASVIVQWKYHSQNGDQPRVFLLDLTELELGIKENCCQKFPRLEMPVEKGLPYYEIEIGCLNPAAKYRLRVATSGAAEEASQTVEFTTPLPSLPVLTLPKVKVATNDDWMWLPQELTNSIENPHVYKPFIKHYLLLVVPEDASLVEKSGVVHQKISALLKDLINKPFFVASHYNESDIIVLEDGKTGDSEWGSYNNMDLPNGAIFQLAATQVAHYGDTYSADVVLSTPFRAEP